MKRCGYVKKDTSKCLAYCLKGKKSCFWHSKGSKVKSKAAAVKGGKGKIKLKIINLPRVESSKDIIKLLNRALGEIEKVPDAESRATLVLRAVNSATKALTTSDLEDRLTELEGKIIKMNRGLKI